MKINKDQLIMILGGLVLFMAGYILGNKTPQNIPQSITTENIQQMHPDGMPQRPPDFERPMMPEFFISNELAPDNSGVSMMIRRFVGGQILLEQCFAPDYSQAVAKGMPERKPCKMLLNGSIEKIDGEKFVIKSNEGKTQEVSLKTKDGTSKIEFGTSSWLLISGQKHILLQKMEQLPSHSQDRQRFQEHMAKMQNELAKKQNIKMQNQQLPSGAKPPQAP